MVKNYIKIAIRIITNQKFYSFINVCGLSIGIAVSLLITLYIMDEFSYDRFHKNAKNIHEVYLKGRLNDQEFFVYASCNPLGPVGIEEIPELEDFCRVALWTDMILKYEDIAFTEDKMLLADSNFFEFFTYQLIEGDPHTVLKEPNSIVLTESLAKKYFNYEGPGDTNPLGKLMNIGNGDWLHKVTGIVEDPPHNTHIKFDLVMSLNSWEYMKRNQWTSNNLTTFFLLNDNAELETAEGKIAKMVVTYVGPEVQQFLGISLEEFEEKGGSYGYFLTPLLDLHLKAATSETILEPHGDIKYVYILSAIALFIIVIACINFMNLSTARSANRAKEVGIRKTVGAQKGLLVSQFLLESVFFSLISMIIAFIIVYLTISTFNQISGKPLQIMTFFQPVPLMGMIMLIILVGLLAGSYPAFYLTAFKPTEVLRGRVVAGIKSSGIRSGLVIFQFSVSIGLIICTMLVYKQLQHLQKKNLGFSKENILIISNGGSLGENKLSYVKEINTYNDIQSVSISNTAPPAQGSNSVFRALGPDQEDIMLNYYYTDYDFIDTYQLEIVNGRFFSKDFPSDSSAIVINESAAELIGWEDPIGQIILDFNQDGSADERNVIGVLKDFNYQSLKTEIAPMAMVFGDWGNTISVKIQSNDVQSVIQLVENKWKEMNTGAPFEYAFLDENFDRLYRAEQRLGKIFLIFTFFAILVACLGLFGLATFTAEQRAKEIGIRKAMGASVGSVILLLSKDYIKLIVISFIIAIPVSFYIISQWLQNFAYRINIGVLVFLLAGGGALIIAWLTVSYQSIKAASANPVNSLRYE